MVWILYKAKIKFFLFLVGYRQFFCAYPECTTYHNFANYFGVSIDYLLGKSDVRNTSTIDFSKDELHIALSAEDKGYISEDVKKAIENYAKFVIEEEKKKEEKNKKDK